MAVSIGKRAEYAQRMIVRYIWDHSLSAGDKLPSCQVLGEVLGLSSATVFRAVKQMQDQGILECRDKVGVFVKDARTPGRASYNIAILAEFNRDGRFVTALSCKVQQVLEQNGARGVLSSCPIPVGINSANLDVLSATVGLREGIEQGNIHGILTEVAMSRENWDWLRAHKIPCCYLGGFTYLDAPMAVTIDLKQMLEVSFERVAELGLKHPAYFLPEFGTEKQIMKAALHRAEAFSAFDRKKDCFRKLGQNNYREMCLELLSRKPKDRPDALICPDDEYAQKIYGFLIRENGTEYLPHPIVLGRADVLREFFPTEVDFLEYDISKIANEGVHLVLNSLKNGNLPENPVRVLPTVPDFIEKNV